MAATRWPLPDRAAFLPWAATMAAELSEAKDELFVQQRFCRHYLSHDGPHRGLVLYHGLGSGKSCSAIATSEALRAAAGRDVYVMLPASLRRNYMTEVRKCGGRMFRESQAWRRLASGPETQSHPWIAAVGPRTLAANGGSLWVPDEALGVPFDDLQPSDREAVSRQVDDAIARTHKFVHYNGLTARSVAALVAGDGSKRNPFDDAVVVIDEVHNFASNLGLNEGEAGGSKLVVELYRSIFDARRCKVVLLSGTPLVNEPEEVAVLANLAAGPVVVHEVPLGPQGLSKEAEARLAACPSVRDFWEEVRDGGLRQVLRIRLVPEGFRRSPDDAGGTFVTRTDRDGSETAQLGLALEAVGGVAASAATRRQFELIPSDPIEFRARFLKPPRIDREGLAVEELEAAAEDELARMLVGTVSYFKGHDTRLYPTLRSISMVLRPLSPRQFSEYTTQRVGERKREEAAKRYAVRAQARGGTSVGVGVRPFSRAACTFVFPEGIVRPRRAEVAAAEALAAAEEAAASDDDPTNRRRVDRAYQAAVDAAIEALRSVDASVLRATRVTARATARAKAVGGLADLSPKFDAIVGALIDLSDRRKPLSGRGTAIVYSQFRRAEGVAILAVALEANGFVQLDVATTSSGERVVQLLRGGRPVKSAKVKAMPKYIMYNNDDPEVAADLLRIFNDDVPNVSSDSLRRSLRATLGDDLSNLRGQLATALLITRSGSEGISTRNVRQVHVIEPFWHANRVDQVIGRARRAHSHDALPPEDRTVDVFIYAATFTKEQAKAHGKDAGRTSDEHVHMVAQRKRALLLRLLNAMKRGAVDCASYGPSSVPEGGCVAAPKGSGPDALLYDHYKAR